MMIAERVLQVATPDGLADVPIRLYAPLPEDNCWSCRWEIHWPGGVESRSGYGLDAVQAMHIAMQMVALYLYHSDEHEDGHLRFWVNWKGYGFPGVSTVRDQMAEDDQLL